MRHVMRQLREVHEKPVDSIAVLPSGDLSCLRFELDGPEGTPFREGRFLVALEFDEQYPEVPPRGFFRTPIFHPNVAPETGDICVNALKRDWDKSLGLRHILVVIRCLLVEPNPESALNEVAGRLLLEDYAAYERQCAMMTRVHALRGDGVPRHTAPDEGETTSAQPESQDGSGEAGTAGAAPHAGEAPGLRNVLDGNSSASMTAAEKAKKRAAEKRKSALRRI